MLGVDSDSGQSHLTSRVFCRNIFSALNQICGFDNDNENQLGGLICSKATSPKKDSQDEESSAGSLSPSSTASSVSSRQQRQLKAAAKSQGKMTDFITRTVRTVRDPSDSPQTSPQGKASPAKVAGKRDTPSRRESKDSANSLSTRQKRGSTSSPAVATKKQKPSEPEPSPAKRKRGR